MENIIDYLKQLDLSDAEAKLYLTLVQTGPTSVRDLAQTVDIKRTTAYFYIDQLVGKGLIMKLVRGSKKLVAASEPENLKILVEEKLLKANEVKKDFPNILKLLNTSLSQENSVNDAEIAYYKGKNGIKKIYEDVLKAKEIRSYVNIEDIANILPENFQLFDNALKHNKDILMLELVEDSPKAREMNNNSSTLNPNYFYKFFPGNAKIQSTDIFIYDGKVSFINLRDNVHGVVLRNTDLYNNFKILFNFMWEMLPEVTKDSQKAR